MIARAFRLEPRSAFHFGREGTDLETSVETLPSDSLFAALVVAHLEAYGVVESFVAAWDGSTANRISSLFPYVGTLPLFPLPRIRVEFSKDSNERRGGKALKKLRYVSPAILTALLTGQTMDSEWQTDARGGKPRHSLQGGTVWIADSERNQLPDSVTSSDVKDVIWHSDAVPRVAVDRQSASSQIYQLGRTTFNHECGVWFLAQTETQAHLDTLTVLVNTLADSGIGGERSAGYGAFRVSDTPLALPRFPAANGTSRVMTLSRYFPRSEELSNGVLGAAASYELVTVGGWMASPNSRAQRRKSIHMIEAGSVLDTSSGDMPIGALVDVRPEYKTVKHPHPVWRSGIALTIGVAAQEKP